MFDTKQPIHAPQSKPTPYSKLNCNQPITKPNCHTAMPTASQIEALLPQTQCRQCGYDGCAPYAQAIAQGQAPINLCPPGGDIVLQELAELLHTPPLPLAQPEKAAIKALAYIDETACIGCTACIKACPVDAILGASKLMHTVLADECTGCGLCLPPCPVDCIEMQPVSDTVLPRAGAQAQPEQARRTAAAHAKQRFQHREQRQQRAAAERQAHLAQRAAAVQAAAQTPPSAQATDTPAKPNHPAAPAFNPADLIARAMASAQARQNQRTVPSNHDSFRQQQIAAAQQQAAHRRALKNIRYGNEAEQAAAKDFLKQQKNAADTPPEP